MYYCFSNKPYREYEVQNLRLHSDNATNVVIVKKRYFEAVPRKFLNYQIYYCFKRQSDVPLHILAYLQKSYKHLTLLKRRKISFLC